MARNEGPDRVDWASIGVMIIVIVLFCGWTGLMLGWAWPAYINFVGR